MATPATALAANEAEFELAVDPHAPGELRVLAFEAEEALSRTFTLDATVAPLPDVQVDAPGLLGKPARLVLHLGDADRVVHGIVAEVKTWEEGGADDARRLALRVVPAVWRLGQGRRSRIFQRMTAPEIVHQVLADAGIPDDHRLSGAYARREYCVQYGESDLDLVSRLLEEEGIFWLLEHGTDEATVVLCDRSTNLADIPGDPGLRFREPSQMIAGEEFVDAFSSRLAVRAGSITLRDFDPLHPGVDLTSGAAAEGTGDAAHEIYEYPGRYREAKDGKQLAKVRLEAERARVSTLGGRSSSRRLEAGRGFTLLEHPLDELNGDYLVVAVAHRGDQRELLLHGAQTGARGYTNEFRCVPKTVPFRPERRTPRPIIPGAQTAIVTGPSGEEIHTDEHGRIKVQFHWDRDQRREESSCWIRVAQAWAGPGWGALYLPRVGHEVVVEFLDGDPDRPIVTGSVYNGANPPPISLPSDKTRSTLRSASSPGSNGSNELRFEDAAGQEEIYLHAQKDLSVVVENDQAVSVGHDERLEVRQDRSRAVGGNQTLEVTGNDGSTIGGDQTSEVGGNRTVTIGGNHVESVAGNQATRVGGTQAVTVAAAATESIGGAKALSVGGAYAVTVGGALNELVGGLKAEEVGGAKVDVVGGKKVETVAGSRSVSVGKDLSETVGGKRTLKVAKDVVVNVGGKLQQGVKDAFTLKAKTVTLSAEDEVVLQIGKAKLTFKKNGDVAIDGRKIEVKASGNLVLKATKITEN